LGQGTLDGDYVVCPWHYWKFHHKTGQGEPGHEQDLVPSYATKIESGRLYIDLSSAT
jgi:nitrite reductase/ring-hydroxylating ferredoxin subunit